MIERPEGFVPAFIKTLESALENIDPENFASHQAMALLVGRPLAILRASLSLQLRGEPAVHQGWDSFFRDLRRNTRETRGMARVTFPVRLGEHRQLNDGLVGYWKENHNGEFSDGVFYSPQGNDEFDYPSEEKPLLIDAKTDDDLFQAIDAPPQTLTMIVDPRGVVHATCGILPSKAISIPPDHYADALAGIRVTFLTAPVLTNQGEMNLPTLPAEPGLAWSWIERQSEGHDVTVAQIGKANTEATFAAPQQLREGWLMLGRAPRQTDRG